MLCSRMSFGGLRPFPAVSPNLANYCTPARLLAALANPPFCPLTRCSHLPPAIASPTSHRIRAAQGKPPRMNRSKKQARKSFVIRTYDLLNLKSPGMNTYEKRGEGVATKFASGAAAAGRRSSLGPNAKDRSYMAKENSRHL